MAARLQLAIRRPGRNEHVFDLEPGVYAIGSDPDNRIVLPDPSVAWRHAVLSCGPDGCRIEDLMSPGGTVLAGAPVEGRADWPPGQTARIGVYELELRPAAAAPPIAAQVRLEEPPASLAEEVARRSIRRQIHQELLHRLNIKRLAAGQTNEDELKARARQIIEQIIAEVGPRLPAGTPAAALANDIYHEAVGLGPLEEWLADPSVTEIMVNGPDRIYLERGGKLALSGRSFLDEDSVMAVIERIVAPIGRRIDESQPYVDARLPDGSRVNAIIHPLSLSGPCLTIRKFARTPFTVEDMIRFGTWTADMAEFLRVCVRLRRNMIVSGGTGSGKTSLLNVLSGFLPSDERILTIEDAAELRLNQPHVIRLEARPPNMEGRGAVPVRDLVRNALRMRPDRIVVGECRGPEALDMLQAMNTGHEGSLTTVHANSPRDAVSRLETMVLMAGMDLPLRAIREQIGAAIHLIVHETRCGDGSRKIARITEVNGLEGDQLVMQDIFHFRQTGVDAAGRVLGRFEPTGAVPVFLEDMAAQGVTLDRAMFDPDRRSVS